MEYKYIYQVLLRHIFILKQDLLRVNWYWFFSVI